MWKGNTNGLIEDLLGLNCSYVTSGETLTTQPDAQLLCQVQCTNIALRVVGIAL